MRVTAQTKAATRQRILEAAGQLFASKGFDAATTRDIADAAGVASGTLFNYFATKEAILSSLASEAAASVGIEVADGGESFEEDVFAFAAAGLRKLRPLRQHLAVLLETALHPLATTCRDNEEPLRAGHLETVARLAKKHGLGELPAVALQLYWTLYTGVLMFYSSDRSPKQEDTLALLDHSLAMFVGWLQRECAEPAGKETKTEGEPCPPR
jgi:AcrR family transcriptional regulator